MYKKLKKQNGEKFARTIRDYHNGILEIPDVDIILRHAGGNAKPLLPYLTSLLTADDSESIATPKDPFVLLDQAGYEAFHADTLEKQNSIKHYFKKGELLCTFNDEARHKRYHIINAVKKDVDTIKREDFNGEEKREDEYGTSVISIQMLKKGGFISIKNRYNHTVSNCDNTFGSNPDNIINGLSSALKDRFNVDFSVNESPLPEGFTVVGNQIFRYNKESNNVYYGDQAWAKDGQIHTVDRSAGDALFDWFLFDNKSKMLRKIDPLDEDSFADDFNSCYGGNPALNIQDGNLTLNGDILIGAEQSQIRTIYLPDLTMIGDSCLSSAHGLNKFEAPALTAMGDCCFFEAHGLTKLEVPALTSAGGFCLFYANVLTEFKAPALTTMGNHCLRNADKLTKFEAPALTTMGNYCLRNVGKLIEFEAPALTTMGNHCLRNADKLTKFDAPLLSPESTYLKRFNILPNIAVKRLPLPRVMIY